MTESAVLGIDIGTTTVKVAIVCSVSHELLGTWSCDTAAAVVSDAGPLANEQDVIKILSAVNECMSQVSVELKSAVVAIGVCGQMHGTLFWKRNPSLTGNIPTSESSITERFSKLSHLYTWQDGRCSSEFMDSLPPPKSHLRMATGFGCATIFWLTRHKPGSLEIYECAGTIHDFLVTVLCDLAEPVMTPQNAASWGYFDTATNTWNTDLLTETDFPVKLLPAVVDAGCKAGALSSDWHGISKGVPVTAAMGDLHCYVLSKVQHDSDAVINVGTSSQFTFIMPVGFSPILNPIDKTSPVEYVPYFDGRYLSETASLNGGNALASFVTTLHQWIQDLGISMEESEIWKRVGEFVSNDRPSVLEASCGGITIDPLVLGERHIPNVRTVIVHNALPSNASLNNIARSLSWGVIANLRSMSPVHLPTSLRRIIGSGGALARSAVMRNAVLSLFGLPLHMDVKCGNADSAVGAALAAARYLLKQT